MRTIFIFTALLLAFNSVAISGTLEDQMILEVKASEALEAQPSAALPSFPLDIRQGPLEVLSSCLEIGLISIFGGKIPMLGLKSALSTANRLFALDHLVLSRGAPNTTP